jgi:hypothetical protein
MSMTYSGSALPIYLYGYTNDAQRDEGGQLIVATSRIEPKIKWNVE